MPSTEQQPREGTAKATAELAGARLRAVRSRRAPQAPAGARRSCCGSTRCAASCASCTLLTLDFVRRLHGDPHGAVAEGRAADRRLAARARQAAATDELFDFAFLVTVLLFARSGLYSPRGERPGMTRIVSSLFQVALVALVFAVASGHQFTSYYIFYGSLFFAVDLRLAAAAGLREVHRRAAARWPATSAARCSSAAASTSRPSATRCATPRTRRSTSSASSR